MPIYRRCFRWFIHRLCLLTTRYCGISQYIFTFNIQLRYWFSPFAVWRDNKHLRWAQLKSCMRKNQACLVYFLFNERLHCNLAFCSRSAVLRWHFFCPCRFFWISNFCIRVAKREERRCEIYTHTPSIYYAPLQTHFCQHSWKYRRVSNKTDMCYLCVCVYIACASVLLHVSLITLALSRFNSRYMKHKPRRH